MASIDKAAIVFTMAIVAIALGFTASGGSIQDAGPTVSTPTVSSIEPEEMMEETPKVEEKMMEEPTEQDVELEEEIMMEEEEEVMMEETMDEPQTVHVEIPVGTSVPGCEESNSCFSPADISINVGDRVHWMNVDTGAHTATSGSASEGPLGIFDSDLLMADETYSFTFEEAGIYDYFCRIHPWMVGSVTVN